MKRNYFWLLCVAFIFSSCAQTYNFVQVFETKSSSKGAPLKPQNGGLVYEDDNCILFYSLWAERGDASFAIHNKTNQIMYVDLSKSFFIRNGIANDYYKERAWSETQTNTLGTQTTTSASISGNLSYSRGASATWLGNFGSMPLSSEDPVLTSANVQRTESYGLLYSTALANSFATSKSASVAIKEQKIIALPPHSTRIVAEYSITDELMLSCDLERYPNKKSEVTYDENNSPLKFANYVTYRIGHSEQDIVVENSFYISRITNYAEPEVIEYIEQDKVCDNLKHPDGVSNSYKIYQRYVKSNIVNTSNSFYLTYKVQCSKQVYKPKYSMWWHQYYNGYTGTIY